MTRIRSETVHISAPIENVWQAITDVTRMGEWSPECISSNWINGSVTAMLGAEFDGVNVVRIGTLVIKKWTTESVIVECNEPTSFAFVADRYTEWRYVLSADGIDRTTVTESFSYTPQGLSGHLYDRVLGRPHAMSNGMRKTLMRLKATVEKPASI